MQIDEQKILDHYLARRRLLMQELDSINIIIDNIEWNLMLFGKDQNKNIKQDVPSINGSSERDIPKIPRLDFDREISEFQIKQFKKFSKYNNSFTYNDKVHFALTKVKSATVHEMVDVIRMYDESVDEKKLYNGLTMAASALNISQEISSKKEGKRNRYYLKFDDEIKTTKFEVEDDDAPF